LGKWPARRRRKEFRNFAPRRPLAAMRCVPPHRRGSRPRGATRHRVRSDRAWRGPPSDRTGFRRTSRRRRAASGCRRACRAVAVRHAGRDRPRRAATRCAHRAPWGSDTPGPRRHAPRHRGAPRAPGEGRSAPPRCDRRSRAAPGSHAPAPARPQPPALRRTAPGRRAPARASHGDGHFAMSALCRRRCAGRCRPAGRDNWRAACAY